jgi:uncharacterized metal-binding protein YceD (DUF177 family)
MIKISVKGMEDGNKSIVLTYPTEKLTDLTEYFFDDIRITGKLVKLKDRINFDGSVECEGKFICDRSLKEYDEIISNDLKWTCIMKTAGDEETQSSEPGMLSIGIDETEIDITGEVIEQLLVAIPMKKIAPEFRDKDITEIYPDFTIDEDERKVNTEWSKLKNLNLIDLLI